MKKLIFLCLTFSKIYTSDYNLVLMGKNSDNLYCYSTININDLVKSPEINNAEYFNIFLNREHLFNVLSNSIYSAPLIQGNDTYKIDIEPTEFRKYNDNDFKRAPLSILMKTIMRPLISSYYKISDYFCGMEAPQNENPVNMELVNLLGKETLSLLFKGSDEARVYCVCIIKKDVFEQCFFDYLTTYCRNCLEFDEKEICTRN